MCHNEERQSSADGGTEGYRRTAERDGTSTAVPGSLIAVSNRQPYRHEYADDDSSESSDSGGQATVDGGTTGGPSLVADTNGDDERPITVDRPTGGLTAGLDPVLRRSGGTWIAWGDGDADRDVTGDDGCVQVPPEDEEGAYTLQRVWLSDEAVDAYYRGFSNRVLWPLCHGFPDIVEYRPNDLEWYRAVNRQFADAVADHATDDAVVWLQDYHFGLAPAMIRESVPRSVTIAQFWHIPWPAPAVFHRCPARRELLEGLLGNDLLGFHVDRYCEHFLECVDAFVPGAIVDSRRRVVHYRGREIRIVATPMGVDAAAYDQQSRSIDVTRWDDVRENHGIPKGNAIGLGVDRLDYTKGIPERLAAVERFFERNPAWRGEFTFVQKSMPSRTEIPTYQRHGEYVRSEVDRINARFEQDGWRPIVYVEEYLPRADLCALYRRADVMVVSPLVDGMNLVAQEYVAASVDGDGSLVLSSTVGAHETLGEFVYTIEPRRREEFATTIEAALTAPPSERRRRMDGLRRRVFERDLESWMHAQFGELRRLHEAGHSANRNRSRRPRST
ncbi:trehalose-6-phosphate synthase [Natribaculum luteum]|uniref:Trehalose-6-phosphate synthase n=1 Tax=Natribaculum luteum TaxID=1586232 RepID=A0ABD5P1G5_9EURY|nr:trehalose-6-phosphate synthase [Natribaculum luteum]